MKLTHLFPKVFLLFVLLSFMLQSYAQQVVSLRKVTTTQKHIDNLFAKGKIPPFSFVYDGENSDSFIRNWKFSKKKMACDKVDVLKYEIVYTEPNGVMELRCDVTGYTDYEAVEWVLHFTNRSSEKSPNIKNVSASDIQFVTKAEDNFTIYTARGSNGTRQDFAPVIVKAEIDSTYSFSPKHGRSSDTDGFPFFNIATDEGRGVMLSIGWTGTWFADFSLNEGKLRSMSGMKNTDLFLYPGESIRTPLVSFMFWSGMDRIDGQNKFRQFILTHHTRKINDKNAEAPLCGGFEWGDPAPCNEYTCLTEDMAIAMAKRYKQFGIIPDVFWLDAGWYNGSGGPNFEGKNWYNTVGDWRVDEERFPDGFKNLSRVIHGLGAKFMVWFEPERVYKNTYFDKEFPQWIISLPNSENRLFDLGNREACDYLCKYIGDFMEENGIDYYRQDFNFGPDRYWNVKDQKEGRKGISEIRHIEGLYRFWDYLIARFPEIQIDNCASGGRRIDLETTSRSLPLWRTDYNYGEPNGYQNQTYNLSMFIPLNGTGLYKTDPYHWRSSISSAMALNWENTSRGVGHIKDMQKIVAKFKTIKQYYLEDFYPLCGNGNLTGDDCCIAYQLNKKNDNSGYVFAFRRGAEAAEKMVVKLRGLLPDAIYKVTNEDTNSVMSYSGEELMEGVEIAFDKAPSSVLLFYKVE